MMADCIFCKIIAGEIGADHIYEDVHTMAFLDIHPNTKGHTLVVPKIHVADFLTVDQETMSQVMATVQKVSRALIMALGAEGFNVGMNNGAAAGQAVFHWHTHIIPRTSNDGLKHWEAQSYAHGEAQALAEKIKSQLA